MPYVSNAQRRYFHANRKKLEAQGVDVTEWDKSSKGKKIPERVEKTAQRNYDELLDRSAARRGVTRAELDKQLDKLVLQLKQAGTVTSVLAPMSNLAQELQMAREVNREKPTPERLADLLEARTELDEIEDEKKPGTFLKDTGKGALVGGLTLGGKALLAAGGAASAATALAPLGIGAGVGAAAGAGSNLLLKLTAARRRRHANDLIRNAYRFDTGLLRDPKILASAEKYRSGTWGPLIGAEAGAGIGALAGSIAAGLTTPRAPTDKPASVLGYNMPFTQHQAERMSWAGLGAGIAGAGAGLLAGVLYKKYKRRQLLKTIEERLKTASVWMRDNGILTQPNGGNPAKSSNRRLMLNQQPEQYAAGQIAHQQPDVTPELELYGAGKKVATEVVDKLIGGLADGRSAKEFDPKQVLKGAVVETEHTNDPKIPVEIAKDHLAEIPDYYDRLERMEKAAANMSGVARALRSLETTLPSAPAPKAVRLKPPVSLVEPKSLDISKDSTVALSAKAPGPRTTDIVDLNSQTPVTRFDPELAASTAQSKQMLQSKMNGPVNTGMAGSPVKALHPNQAVAPATLQNTRMILNKTQLDRALAAYHIKQLNAPAIAQRAVEAAAKARSAVLKGFGLTTAGMAGAGAAAANTQATPGQPVSSPTPGPEVWAGGNGVPERKVAAVKAEDLVLRQRAEAVVTNDKGVLAIKKPGYLLLPGGGLNEGETPELAVIREALEEAGHALHDVEEAEKTRNLFNPENILSPGFDGQETQFFTADGSEDVGSDHEDKEDFQYIPFDEAIEHLVECMSDEANDWDQKNNAVRLDLIVSAKHADDDLHKATIAIGDSFEKKADAPVTIPRSEFVLFNQDGKLVAKRRENRRFELPTEGTGKPALYEPSIRYLPPEGVPEHGVHGYDIGLRVGETAQIPEGYQAIDPQDAIKDLYASMGMNVNRPYQSLDRARARVILRALKARKPKHVVQEASAAS